MASSHKAPAQNRPKPALPPTPKVLRALVSKIDAKTLHAYVLAHLPTAPPDTLVALASFFATLRPAPRLHCVRCHSDYIEVENDDRSCHVPHDEDSGDIERVGGIGRNGIEYETHFSCCGKIVEGDEDPPDGWCYEGMHTTDVKRARFRADSTSDDDMLEFCGELDCHVIGAPPWQPRATSSAGGARPRPPPHPPPMDLADSDDDDDDNASRYTEDGPVVVEIVRTVGAMGQKTVGPRRTKTTARKVPRGRSLNPACASMHLAAQAARRAARRAKSEHRRHRPQRPERPLLQERHASDERSLVLSEVFKYLTRC